MTADGAVLVVVVAVVEDVFVTDEAQVGLAGNRRRRRCRAAAVLAQMEAVKVLQRIAQRWMGVADTAARHHHRRSRGTGTTDTGAGRRRGSQRQRRCRFVSRPQVEGAERAVQILQRLALGKFPGFRSRCRLASYLGQQTARQRTRRSLHYRSDTVFRCYAASVAVADADATAARQRRRLGPSIVIG